MPKTLTPQQALSRINAAVEQAAQALERDRTHSPCDPSIAAAYDQGRTDELNRILTLISVRLERLQPQSAGARELRLFRLASLERNQA